MAETAEEREKRINAAAKIWHDEMFPLLNWVRKSWLPTSVTATVVWLWVEFSLRPRMERMTKGLWEFSEAGRRGSVEGAF